MSTNKFEALAWGLHTWLMVGLKTELPHYCYLLRGFCLKIFNDFVPTVKRGLLSWINSFQ